jgi:hypothetical protein
MHVIRHQAIAQQNKTVKVGVVPQQLQISKAVPVAGEYYLPGIPTRVTWWATSGKTTRAKRAMG